MPKKKYEVKLSKCEKTHLSKIAKTGKSGAKEIAHAKILLATDDGRIPKLTVKAVAEKCDAGVSTVQRIRKRYSEEGLDAALTSKQRKTPPIEPKITGEVEARIIALACSEPPKGFSKWSLRLLANKAVELEYIENISHVSVGTVLKKRNSSPT
jgi:transposase